MTAQWRLAKSLGTLREQVNFMAPERSKVSDGTIGDEAHSSRKSEHNPNEEGVVRAMDITHDPAHGCDAGELALSLVASRDPRILYIIWNRQICSSAIKPWTWRAYNGTNPHTKHMHISVVDSPLYDQAKDWKISLGPPAPRKPPPDVEPVPTTKPEPTFWERLVMAFATLFGIRR